MELRPMPHYFIIRIEIEKQKERKEKIGNLYLHHSEVQMQRNMQQGEVVAIGSVATKQFPEVTLNSTLLFHHFVEGSEREKSNLIATDETYQYYYVTASEYNGHRCESYGVALSNGEIIPHPDFIFVEKEGKVKEISADEFIEKHTKQVGSLILFDNWEEKREDKEAKATRLMNEIKHSSKGRTISESTKHGIEDKQREAEQVTASLTKKEYKSFPIAFAHPSLHAKNNVYALSMAVQTIFEFNGKEYYVVQSKYTAATA